MASKRYELWVLLLLTLANGVVAFDRLTVAYLSPYIVAEMGVSNADLGLLAAALSGAVAVSSFFGGRLADRTGSRKAMPGGRGGHRFALPARDRTR